MLINAPCIIPADDARLSETSDSIPVWSTTLFIAICLATGAVFAHAQSSQAPELIEWSSGRKLLKSDFKGAVAMQRNVAARSFISIQASWSCDGDRLDVNIRAVFDPSRSTWSGPSAAVSDAASSRPTRPTNLTSEQLLEHEQTHFDIAELFARKIRVYFSQITDACSRRGGTVPLAAIVEEYQTELDDQQARYDRQTGFGTDPRTQWAWTSQTSRALKTSTLSPPP